MSRTFAALMVFVALASLPVASGAEPGRARFASRDAKMAQAPAAPSVPAEGGEEAAADPAADSSQSAEPQSGEAAETVAAPDEPQPELVVERYATGQVKIKRYVVQDAQRNYVNHGPWTLFDGAGNPVATGNYKLGKREGSWSRVQTSGSKSFAGPAYKGFGQPFVWEAAFADDVLNGLWTMLDSEGRPIRTWEFEHGRLHGKSVDWHANGQKRRELRYEQGTPQGELREWDETGKLTAQLTYLDGRPHRSFIEKYPTGERQLEGWFLGPKEVVRVTFNWWEGTMRVDISRVDGKDVRHGLWVGWHREGGRQYEGAYDHDLAVDVHTWWHANGQKQICGHFVTGRETGRWTWWHENGRKSLEGEFVDGKKEGHWAAWHANGQKQQAGGYAADKKIGQWSSWSETGKLINSRDRSADSAPAGTSPVSKPANGADQPTDASAPPANTPSSRQSKQVPELLQRWRGRDASAPR